MTTESPQPDSSDSDCWQTTSTEDDDADPKFCNKCAAITYQAVRSERGHAHVSDVRELRKTWQTCDLYFLIVTYVIESARHEAGVVNDSILALDDDLQNFELGGQRKSVAIQEPYAITLFLSPSFPNVLAIDV